MKLGEALLLRADLNKRIYQVQERISASVVVQEGDDAPDDPNILITELNDLFQQLHEIIAKINAANSAPLGAGTLGHVLLERNILSKRIRAFQDVVAKARDTSGNRYSHSEIKNVRTVNVTELQAKVDTMSARHRQLDTELQAANWAIDLL